ncbi:DUF2007 domain-containing protein [Chloroflexota bacterium]
MKLVEVYRAVGEMEAQAIKGLLESNGILCLLNSNAAPSVHAFAVNGMGEVRIKVKESQSNEARSLIVSKGYV